MIRRNLIRFSKRWYSSASASAPASPLQGIKIIDLTRVLAGPFCTQILADYGADVIKIEHPSGDDTRHWRSKKELDFWNPDAKNVSLYFSVINRNKRSMVLDLKSQHGKDILLKLVKGADVLVDNFIPGKMEELGFGYESLSKMNPRLIHASISGYGTTGPYAKRAGYDLIAGAEGGLLHITGYPDSPVRPGLGLVDMCTGLYTHGAILAALQARHATGKGTKIDSSLFETQISLMSNVAMTWLNTGVEAQRWGNAHPSIVPYDSFETADSRIVLGAVNDAQFAKLCKLLGCEKLLKDERFTKNEDRVAHRDDLMPVLKDIFRQKSTQEWMDMLEGSGMPYGPINTVQGAFEHDQVKARNMVNSVEDQDAAEGQVKVVGMPVKFGGGNRKMKRAPKLGEHTKDIIDGLNVDVK